MITKFKSISFWLLLAVSLATVVMSSCKEEDDVVTSTKKSTATTTVKAKYVEKFPTLIYSNAANFFYKIEWESVKDATGYNIYKSKSVSGAGDNVSSVEQTAASIESNEIITQTGNTLYYYWVTAITKKGESNRPSNGGIKVTYRIVEKHYYGVPSYYECTRSVEQNSKE